MARLRRRPFIVYAGSVAGLHALRELIKFQMGRLIAATAWKNPEPRIPWCFDNGAYHAYRKALRTGKTPVFPEREFTQCLWDETVGVGKIEMGLWGATLRSVKNPRRKPLNTGFASWPDFGVCPDIVMGGRESLHFSLGWIDRLPRQIPWLFAAQDGMSLRDIAYAWEYALELECPFSGIFVGGSDAFKDEMTPSLVRFVARRANDYEPDPYCHVGRVSRVERIAWAIRVGATSVDSSAFGRAHTYQRAQEARNLVRVQRHLADRVTFEEDLLSQEPSPRFVSRKRRRIQPTRTRGRSLPGTPR